MSDNVSGGSEKREALEALATAQTAEQIVRIVAEHPFLRAPGILDEIDREVDEIERTRQGDWWGLTRARILLAGYQKGELDDTLVRCWTRDLLPLGPDDVRRRVEEHVVLLGQQSDALLEHLAAQKRAAGQATQAQQIDLRRELLREIAAGRIRALADESLRHEREFEASGDLGSLERALAIRRHLTHEATAPFQSTEVRIAGRQGISRLLQQRFRVAGVLGDIDAAVAEADEGIAALPEGHPVRQVLLSELGNALNLRFRELRRQGDIDRAIAIFDALAVAGPTDLPGQPPEDRTTNDVNRAVAYLDRYDARKAPEDLARSIELLRGVLSALPPGSPRRSLRANNLGAALYHAFRDTGDRAALDEAIDLQREAAASPDHAFRAHALAALARSLSAASLDASATFREACELGLELNLGAAMWAGMTWGRDSWTHGDMSSAAQAYGYCARGARRLFRAQGSAHSDDQALRLAQFVEVAPRAALALALDGHADDALVAFELSRAQLLMQAIEEGQVLGTAPQLDEPPERAPARPTALPTERPIEKDEIAAIAGDTPLVYLIATDRGGCALLVENGEVTSLPLPELGTSAVAEKIQSYLAAIAPEAARRGTRELDDVLRWLWDAAVGPVLEALPRAAAMVLIPGGLLGLLPLHAAWSPPLEPSGRRRYALDRVAFSYAPNARSLGVARDRARTLERQPAAGHALVVADPQPVSASPLEWACDEGELVSWHFPGADLLPDSSATLTRVSQLIGEARHVHLACHGRADLTAPLRSGVVLSDDAVLRLEQIRTLQTRARLVVLSACETAAPGTPLPDEVVALPSGLLQAGATGVIASLWSVPDQATTILMAELYRRLCRERQAPALALRDAQTWMRDTTDAEKAEAWEKAAGDWLPRHVARRLLSSLRESAGRDFASPWRWAAFVHVGM